MADINGTAICEGSNGRTRPQIWSHRLPVRFNSNLQYATSEDTAAYSGLWDGILNAVSPSLLLGNGTVLKGTTGIKMYRGGGGVIISTTNGITTWKGVRCCKGTSASWDGWRSTAVIPPRAVGTRARTICCWGAYVTWGAGANSWIGMNLSSADGTVFCIGEQGVAGKSGVDFDYIGSTTLDIVIPQDGTWHHLCATVGQAGTVDSTKIYIDGIPRAFTNNNMGSYTHTLPSTSVYHFLAHHYSNSAYQNYGTDFRWYNRELSAKEIKILATRPNIAYEPRPPQSYVFGFEFSKSRGTVTVQGSSAIDNSHTSAVAAAGWVADTGVRAACVGANGSVGSTQTVSWTKRTVCLSRPSPRISFNAGESLLPSLWPKCVARWITPYNVADRSLTKIKSSVGISHASLVSFPETGNWSQRSFRGRSIETLNFNGNGYASISPTLTVGSSFTVSFVATLSAFSTYNGILSCTSINGIRQRGGSLEYYTNAPDYVTLPIVAGKAAHYAFVNNNGVVKGYVNGRLLNTVTLISPGGVIFNTIGKDNGITGRELIGWLSDICVYNSALSPDQIKLLSLPYSWSESRKSRTSSVYIYTPQDVPLNATVGNHVVGQTAQPWWTNGTTRTGSAAKAIIGCSAAIVCPANAKTAPQLVRRTRMVPITGAATGGVTPYNALLLTEQLSQTDLSNRLRKTLEWSVIGIRQNQTNVYDGSGKQRTGSISGFALGSNIAGWIDATIKGYIVPALAFNGTSTYVAGPASLVTATNGYTVTASCWFRLLDSSSSIRTLISLAGYSGSLSSIQLEMYSSNGYLVANTWDANNNRGASVTSTNRVDDGRWHHASVTTTSSNPIGGISQFSIDGALQGSAIISPAIGGFAVSRNAFWIGYANVASFMNHLYWKGEVTGVVVNSSLLTQKDIQRLASHPIAIHSYSPSIQRVFSVDWVPTSAIVSSSTNSLTFIQQTLMLAS